MFKIALQITAIHNNVQTIMFKLSPCHNTLWTLTKYETTFHVIKLFGSTLGLIQSLLATFFFLPLIRQHMRGKYTVVCIHIVEMTHNIFIILDFYILGWKPTLFVFLNPSFELCRCFFFWFVSLFFKRIYFLGLLFLNQIIVPALVCGRLNRDAALLVPLLPWTLIILQGR